jgi:hypothetical protein
VILGYFAVMVAREIRRRKRKWPYVLSGLLLVLVTLARLYLGLDWLSGALLGVALGLAWTFVIGIAYRQRALRPFNGLAASLIFFGMLALTFTWQVSDNLDKDLEAFKLPISQREVAAREWWQQDWQTLPRERTQLKRVRVREFNFQFAGDPQGLARVLADHGWQEAGPVNWRWVVLSLNPEPDETTLPPLRRDFLGRADSLLLHRLGGDPMRQDTLRVWDSGLRLAPGGEAVYLGLVAEEWLIQRMMLFSYWSVRVVPAGILEQLEREVEGLQTRQATDGMLLIREPQASSGP